mmetsp:Transcript_25173/g.63898  ORF Transcript_25173/g.63898 Transcript_25173/m.63898 type:complete len:539 (-) Transcript_25173:216-1832(-)
MGEAESKPQDDTHTQQMGTSANGLSERALREHRLSQHQLQRRHSGSVSASSPSMPARTGRALCDATNPYGGGARGRLRKPLSADLDEGSPDGFRASGGAVSRAPSATSLRSCGSTSLPSDSEVDITTSGGIASRGGSLGIKASFVLGDTVEAMYSDGQWYLATIVHVNIDGAFTITWADRDCRDRVKKAEHLRPARADTHLLAISATRSPTPRLLPGKNSCLTLECTVIRAQGRQLRIPRGEVCRARMSTQKFELCLRINYESLRPFPFFAPRVARIDGLQVVEPEGNPPGTQFTLGDEADMVPPSGGPRPWREGWLSLAYPLQSGNMSGPPLSVRGELHVMVGGTMGVPEASLVLPYHCECAFADVVPENVFRLEDRTALLKHLLRDGTSLMDIDRMYIDRIVEEVFRDESAVARGRIAKTWRDHWDGVLQSFEPEHADSSGWASSGPPSSLALPLSTAGSPQSMRGFAAEPVSTMPVRYGLSDVRQGGPLGPDLLHMMAGSMLSQNVLPRPARRSGGDRQPPHLRGMTSLPISRIS